MSSLKTPEKKEPTPVKPPVEAPKPMFAPPTNNNFKENATYQKPTFNIPTNIDKKPLFAPPTNTIFGKK